MVVGTMKTVTGSGQQSMENRTYLIAIYKEIYLYRKKSSMIYYWHTSVQSGHDGTTVNKKSEECAPFKAQTSPNGANHSKVQS